MLDFTKQEELEKQIKEQQFKDDISAQLDAMIAASQSNTPRNAVVDANKRLRDDRNKNPQEVYDEAKKLQEKLDASRREAEAASDDKENISLSEDHKKVDEVYSGPSVISYRLDGRKSMSLPIPAYKCLGGGDVSIAIIVNPRGYVIGVKIVESVSSSDECIRQYALNAARQSRFTPSESAPERQGGEIVYRFVAQ